MGFVVSVQDRAKELFAEAIDLSEDRLATFCEQVQSDEAAPVAAVFNQMLADYQAAEAADFLSGPAGANVESLKAEDLDESHTSANDATIDHAPAPQTSPSDDDATIDLKATVREAQSQRNDFTVDFLSGESIGVKNCKGDGPGPLLADDYEIRDELGRGGMGTVYRAYQLSLRKEVAVKIIPTHLIRSPEESARFYIEAEAAARLEHPGIVQVQNVGERNGVHYYTMALVTGGSLSRYVDSKNANGRGERLTRRRVAEIMEGVSRAVQYAHDHAVIHRDIKPANIMLDGQGNPKLTDFGLAKLTNTDDHLTMTNQVMGTPSYMAPEQAAGASHAVSNRTDVYSLGATLYALLAGKAPFSGDTLYSTLQKVKESPPAPLSTEVPLDLRTICQKCMEKGPKERYESADALADDLRRYLDGFPISARPVGPMKRVIGWSRRNPVEAGLIGAVAASLIVGFITSTVLWMQASTNLAAKVANSNNLNSALDDTFLFAEEELADQPGMSETRRKLLENARYYYDWQLSQDQISNAEAADVTFRLGKVERELGDMKSAENRFERSLNLYKEQLDNTSTANVDDAMVAKWMQAAQVHRAFAELGKGIWYRGHERNETSVARDGESTWLVQAEQCMLLRQKAHQARPDDTEIHRKYANSLMNFGMAKSQLYLLNREVAYYEEALELLTDAQGNREEMLVNSSDSARIRIDLARGCEAIAELILNRFYSDIAPVARGEEPEWEAIERRIEGVEHLKKIPGFQRDRQANWILATALQKLGNGYGAIAEKYGYLDTTIEASKRYGEMQKVMANLLARDPAITRYRLSAAEASWNLYKTSLQDKQAKKAIAWLTHCQNILADGMIVNPIDAAPNDRLVKYTHEAATELYEVLDQANAASSATAVVNHAQKRLEAIPKASRPEYVNDAILELARTLSIVSQPRQDEDKST